jgi:glycosyltransferase involved in cell wall biosynthesis
VADEKVTVRFLLPRGSEQISGGNLYNAGFLAALERCSAGRRSSIEELEKVLSRREPGTYLLDTLDLDAGSAIARRAPGQRFGLVVHHLPSLEPGLPPTAPAIAVERAVLPLFDFWVATSDYTRELLIARGLPAERVVTVVPGLSVVPRPARAYQPPLVAALIGNLIPRKGVFELLGELAPRLTPADAFELSLVGRADHDPEYARSCRELVDQSPSLQRVVRFAGAVPPREMPRVYGRAALIVSASLMETFGIALQEARAYGIPILTLDRGNAREHVVPGETGWLSGSTAELCERLLYLSRNPEILRAAFARAQAAPVPGEPWDSVVARFLGWLGTIGRDYGCSQKEGG